MKTRLIMGTVMMLICVEGAVARPVSDKERMRQQAEHVCYDDVQRLCSADVPDETKIAACMRAKHGKLSAACRKVFDAGSR